MKNYYYLYAAGASIDRTSVLYQVAVGHSAQADRDFLFLVAFCVQRGYYFEKFSKESDEFLNRCAESLGMEVYEIPGLRIDARDLVRSIKAGGLPPAKQGHMHSHLFFLSVNYRLFKAISKRHA